MMDVNGLVKQIGLMVLLIVLTNTISLAKEVPFLSGPIVDEANLLSDATFNRLEKKMLAHKNATSNQIVVLTIKALEEENLEDYCHTVAEKWGLGEADKNNGVLLLVALDDRKVRIEVGYGLEEFLTDARSSRIVRNEIVPKFRQGDYEGGIEAGVNAVLGSIEGTYTNDYDQTNAPGGIGIELLFILFIFGYQAIMGRGLIGWMLFFVITPVLFTVCIMLIGQPTGIVVATFITAVFVLIKLFFTFTKTGRDMHDSLEPKVSSTGHSGRRWYTGGGGFSGGGGFGGGGGFSGGGGSFGGGGSSGSW